MENVGALTSVSFEPTKCANTIRDQTLSGLDAAARNTSLTAFPSPKARSVIAFASLAAFCCDFPGVRSKSWCKCDVALESASLMSACCSMDS